MRLQSEIEWIDSIFGVMWACLYGKDGQDGHIFQVLTKRSARMREYLKEDRREHWARAAVHYGGGIDPDGRTLMFRVGKKHAGRTLDGKVHDGYPVQGVHHGQ